MLKLEFKIKYRQFLDLKLLSFRRLQPLLNLPPLGGSVSVQVWKVPGDLFL